MPGSVTVPGPARPGGRPPRGAPLMIPTFQAATGGSVSEVPRPPARSRQFLKNMVTHRTVGSRGVQCPVMRPRRGGRGGVGYY
eukprot:598505-Hanusia_phi.AAC.2